MKKLVTPIAIAVLFLSGCALKVIPQQAENGLINTAENSQTITKQGVSIKASSADTEINSYNLDGTVSAFSVVIDNQTDREIAFDVDSFLLLDDENRQYLPLTPDKVKEMVSRDSYYLIPYPYVGFYYLEDYEKLSAYNASNSQLPYYYEVYPQDIYTKSLAAGSIIPRAKVTGLVYFRVDLRNTKAIRFLVFRKGTSKSALADFVFPFTIKK